MDAKIEEPLAAIDQLAVENILATAANCRCAAARAYMREIGGPSKRRQMFCKKNMGHRHTLQPQHRRRVQSTISTVGNTPASAPAHDG